eukprot:g3796.t1
MSSFGDIFKVTTFGESHCKGVGAIIEGCPPGLPLSEIDIQPQLTRRRPGQSKLTTKRDEKDRVTIFSGTENGYTLGTPISLFVANSNIRKRDYSQTINIPRPGHADYTYQLKYGIRASSGGGRSSARETISRVAAGSIAEKWLNVRFNVNIVAFVSSVGSIDLSNDDVMREDGSVWTKDDVDQNGMLQIIYSRSCGRNHLIENEDDSENERCFIEGVKNGLLLDEPAYRSVKTGDFFRYNGEKIDITNNEDWFQNCVSDNVIHVRCPHTPTACRMATEIRQAKFENDSTGGVITCICTNVPTGLGEPCFDKIEAKLAHAMLSIPATKGFEIGSGFPGTRLRGSQHNDRFIPDEQNKGFLTSGTNFAGGTLGGISSGQNLIFRVAFKPVASVGVDQITANFKGEIKTLNAKGRHDPCVLPRAPPIVEGMSALVIADLAMKQLARVGTCLKNDTIIYQAEEVQRMSRLPCNVKQTL